MGAHSWARLSHDIACEQSPSPGFVFEAAAGRAYMSRMRMRGLAIVKGRTLIGLLLAVLFAFSIPLSNAAATMGTQKAAAMSCHDQGAPDSDDGSKPDEVLQHLCCFTACIPLGIADVAASLAPPSGGLPAMPLPPRLAPRIIGIDPPPPKA